MNAEEQAAIDRMMASKDKVGIGSGAIESHFNMAVKTDFDYQNIDLKNLSCRCVVRDNVMTGEYHVAVKRSEHVIKVMDQLRNIETSEVGFVDPTGLLKLDYPIYLKIAGLLFREAIYDILQEIDNSLN